MTFCVITDKRCRRMRRFLFPKSFFPARVAKLGEDLAVRKRQAPRATRCSGPSLRPDQEAYGSRYGSKLSPPCQRNMSALHVKSNDNSLW